jgi:hypothetical protein
MSTGNTNLSMKRSSSRIPLPRTRRACALGAAAALLALGVAGSAQAGGVSAHASAISSDAVPGVSFPTPGAMAFVRLPAEVRSGHHFTLHAELPLAVLGGVVHLQRDTPTGWRTIVSAPPRPRIFWMHWMVPASWRGAQIEVRFVLESGGQLLASSPAYTIGVSA